MREGTPSKRFGHRGLQNVHLGDSNFPLLLILYDANDNVISTLTEEKGACIDPGYVVFFLGPNCRPAVYQRYLVEKLPSGQTCILHDNPQGIARDLDQWVKFLDAWISRHELAQMSVDNQPNHDLENSPKL